MICGYLNLHPCPDCVQPHPDSGHKGHDRAEIQPAVEQTWASPSKQLEKRQLTILLNSASIEDFQDVNKALPQSTEISTPGRPK